MSIRVSVVVPTYKRPHLLRNCLDALLKQCFPPDAYEILVVDDAGCEETRSLVACLQEQVEQTESGAALRCEPLVGSCPDIRYIAATQTQGPAAARNIGWRMARGAIIAFTDDDCLPDPNWLKEGMAALNDHMDGISGRIMVPLSGVPTDYEKNVSRLMECEFVTANCFYRRSALEAIGGFDERFTMAWREDSDLFFNMLMHYHRLGSTSAAKVVHPVRPAPWGVSIKEQRKSLFNALLFKKYPDLYRRLIQSHPPLLYYGVVLSTVGALLAILAGDNLLAVGMAVLWAGLVLHFTWQRLRHTRRTPSHILEMLLTSMLIPYLSVFWRLAGAFRYRVWFL